MLGQCSEANGLPETSSPAPLNVSRHLPSALRNVLSNWAGFACSSVIAFFLSPFVVHHLGNSAYGIWVLVGSLTGYLGLLNLGVRAAVTRYVAQFHAEGDDQEASAVASSALTIFLVAGALAIFLSLTFAVFLVPVFHVPDNYRFGARVIVVLAGLNIAISLVGGVFGGIVAALHRFDLINLIEVGNAVFAAGAIILALSAGNGLITLAMINLAFAIVTGLVFAGVALRLYPALSIQFADCDLAHLKMILSFGVYAFVLQLSYILAFYTDSIVIGAFLGVNFITMFAIAGNLMNSSRSLISGISTTMTPRASTVQATGGQGEVKELLLKATRLATLVMLPIAVTFLLRGTSFIQLWMGAEYGVQSGRVLWILALALIFVAGDQVATSIVMGIGKYRLMVIVVCVEALCNVVLSIALVRRMGIAGVAWGTTLPSMVMSLLFWPWYVRYALGIPIRSYLISTWFRPALAVMPFALLTYCIETLWPAPNLPVFFLQVGAILPTVIFASWYSCLDRSQRTMYAQQFVAPALRTLGWT